MGKEQEILSERARMISGRKNSDDQFGRRTLSVIEFSMNYGNYAFEEEFVSEVLFFTYITAVPNTPPFVMGVINLKGRIVSILNLKVLFNLKDRGLTELNKVIVLKNDHMEFGIASDSITGNKSIFTDTLSPPPETLDNIGFKYIKGVTPDGLILLSASVLLSDKQIIVT